MMAYGSKIPSTLNRVDEQEPSWSVDGGRQFQHRRRSSFLAALKSMIQSTNLPADDDVVPRRASVGASVMLPAVGIKPVGRATTATDAHHSTAKQIFSTTRVLEVKSRPSDVQMAAVEPEEDPLPPLLPVKSKMGLFRPPPPLRRGSSAPAGTHGVGLVVGAKDAEEPRLEKKYGRPAESLGYGSHAEVSVIRSAVDGKVYAVKRFRKQREPETERDYKKRMYSEFCISSTMHHENIVETIDLIRDESGDFCIVMEHCSGGDLFMYLHHSVSKTPRMAEIQCYLRQLVDGVAYMHSLGVAHRDLKPENILLSDSGHIIKICDFGVADVFHTPHTSRLRESKGLCGSEPYIPPEEFEDPEAEYDATKADMWAVGIVFYMLLYGGMPWHRAHKEDPKFRQYIAKVDPTLAPPRTYGYLAFDAQKDPGVREVLYGLLHANPSSRPSAKSIQSRGWFQALSSCHVDHFSTKHTHAAFPTATALNCVAASRA